MNIPNTALTLLVTAMFALPAEAVTVQVIDDFESGSLDLSKWHIDIGDADHADVFNAIEAWYGNGTDMATYYPPEGNWMVVVSAGDPVTKLSTSFTSFAGGSFSMQVFFSAIEAYLPSWNIPDLAHNDFAAIKLDGAEVFSVDTASIGFGEGMDNTGWVNVSQSLAAGHHTLEIEVVNGGGDSYLDSQLAIDDIRVTYAAAPVPEPETWAMLLAGVGLVGFRVRRSGCTVLPRRLGTRPRSMILPLSAASLVFLLSSCGGEGGLSRSKAEQAIAERWNAKGDFPTVEVWIGKTFFRMPEGDYRPDSICPSLMEHGYTPGGFLPYTHPKGAWRNWEHAAKEGFLTSSAGVYSYRDLGQPKQALQCQFDLTDKARPYLVSGNTDRMVRLKAVTGVEVTVTGLTKPTEMLGSKIIEAEFTYTYTLNPLGKALAEPLGSPSESSQKEEQPRQGRALFRLYDDGWRLEGNSNF